MQFHEFMTDQSIFDNGYQMRNPRVSLITPTYSRMAEGFLERCIESVLGQTFTDFEHIIIDDGSSDGSQGLILKYATKDNRIVYVRHEQNSGLPAVRTNEGILLARGEYIAFVFDDNKLEPAFLGRLLQSAEENDADVQYSVVRIPRTDDEPALFSRVPLSMKILATRNVIANGSVLIRKSFFEKVGLYDPHLIIKRLCDWDLWIRALRAGCTFHLVDEVLSEENGMISAVSLGNTTYMDWKVVYAYLLDDQFLEARTRTLRPQAIQAYDVFDPHVLLPYVRDCQEMTNIDRMVYEPFFKKHSEFFLSNPIHDGLYNVRSGMMLYPLLNAASASQRPRIVIMCNLYNDYVQKLFALLRKQVPRAMLLLCMEANVSMFNVGDIDMVLLADCCEYESLCAYLNAWRENDIPVGYCAMHSFSRICNSSGALDYAKHPSIIEESGGCCAYFPDEQIPMSALQQERALKIIQKVDFVIGDEQEGFLSVSGIGALTPFGFFEEHNLYHWAIVQHYLKNRMCFVFINSPLFAGSEVYGVIIAKLLASLRLHVALLMPSLNQYAKYGDEKHIVELAQKYGLEDIRKVDYIPGPYYSNANNANNLVEYLMREEAGFLFSSSLIAEVALAADVLRLPSIFAMFSPAGYRTQELGLLKRCMSGVVSDCQRTCDIYNHTMQLDSIRIIDCLEESMYAQHVLLAGDKVHIAAAGTLLPRKQQLEVVKACVHLIRQGYPIVLNLYGNNTIFTAYVEQIQAYIEKHQMESSIVINGFVEDEQEIARNNDLIVTASVEEGLPQGILFNMAAGLVAVTTPVGGIGEVVIDGETGYLASGFGVSAFEETLKRALDDCEHWPQIVENAQALLRRECSQKKVTGDLLAYMARKMSLMHHTLDPFPSNEATGIQNRPRIYDSEQLRVSNPLIKSRTYTITVFLPVVSKIGLIFAGLEGKVSGTVTISLYYKGKRLRQASYMLETLEFNQWTYFHISPLRDYQGQNVELVIEMNYATKARAIIFEDNRNFTIQCKVKSKLGIPNRKPNLLHFDMLP